MTQQSVINFNEGKYVIGVQTLQKETDESSAMAPYLSESAIITNEANILYLTLMFKDHQTVTGFQVEVQEGELREAIEHHINEETNSRYEMFQLNQLPSILRVRVQYEVEYEGQKVTGDEALRLFFDETSLEKLD